MAENAGRKRMPPKGYGVFELPSGAGHDGMAMIDIADVAMLFVRCRDGISHNPAEHVETPDADTGARAAAADREFPAMGLTRQAFPHIAVPSRHFGRSELAL